MRTARAAHRRHFGRDPRGIWLPECAYRPGGPWVSPLDPQSPAVERAGIEQIVAAQELRYFFVDTHLLSGGRPLGVYADRFEALRHLIRGAANGTAATLAAGTAPAHPSAFPTGPTASGTPPRCRASGATR